MTVLSGIRSGIRSGYLSGANPRSSGTPVSVFADDDTTNQDAYTLGTLTLQPYELGLLWIVQTATAADGVASFTGTYDGSWTLIDTFAVATVRIAAYRSLSPERRSGTIIANFAADDSTTGCLWSCVRVANVKATGSNGADAIRQALATNSGAGTGATVELTSALASARSLMLYGITHNANEGTAPGASFTELGDSGGMATPGVALMTACGAAQSDTPTWATSSVSRWVAVEVVRD